MIVDGYPHLKLHVGLRIRESIAYPLNLHDTAACLSSRRTSMHITMNAYTIAPKPDVEGDGSIDSQIHRDKNIALAAHIMVTYCICSAKTA